MITCSSCGVSNAASSKFCRQCGYALKPSAPAPSQDSNAPADADLQAQLVAASSAAPEEPVEEEEPILPTGTQPLVAPEPETPEPVYREPVLTAGTKVGDYEIIDLRLEVPAYRIYRAQAPANVCQQCGTVAVEPDARFCEECGAELLPHDVLLFEREIDAKTEASGPWRLAELPDDPIRVLLPPINVFEHGVQRYLVAEESVPGYQSLAELLASQGDAPQQPAALDPSDALPISLQLARLLEFLHRNNTALGDLSLAQLLIGPRQALRLRDANDLQPLSDGTRQADLSQLSRTLEDLIRIPRATQKLDTEAPATNKPTLESVLMQGRMGGLPDAAAWVKALESIVHSEQAVKPLQTRIGSYTNVGMHRQLNEDSFFIQESRLGLVDQLLNAGVYVVADGMGGHESGEIASRLAVLAVAQTVSAHLAALAADAPAGVSDDELNDMVVAAAEAANMAVFQQGRQSGNDMGTTLSFALVVGDRCVVGNVGDSRTYLVRQGKMERVSKDHSLVMRLVEVGQITEDEIYSHPHRNAILRSLGEKPQVEVDTFPLRLEAGDILFLCSDGQWEMVRNPRMNEVINTQTDPQAATEQLVTEANQNGGEDNITAVIVRFETPALPIKPGQ